MAQHANLHTRLVSGIFHPRQHDFRISRRGLHHWPADCRRDFCRRRLCLAGCDALPLSFSAPMRLGNFSRNHADRRYVVRIEIYRAYIRPMGAGAVAAAGLITLAPHRSDYCELRCGQAPKIWPKARQEPPGNAAPTATSSLKWALLGVRRSAADHVGHAYVFPHPERRNLMVCRQFLGRPSRSSFRISVCYGLIAHYRPDRELFKPNFRHGHCNSDGDVRHVSGHGLDCHRILRAGHHYRRRGLYCFCECGQYLAGPENRLSCGRNSGQAADWHSW